VKKTLWFWFITIIFAASVFALNIADETTFLSTLIVERRSSAPTAGTATRGRIYFDDVLKSYHGDTGTAIVEILTDTLAAHNILDTLHKDTTVATKVRGGLLVVDSVPKWVQLAKDAAGSILRVDSVGNDIKWLTPGTADQMLGVLANGNELDWRTITGQTNIIDITPTAGDLTIGLHKSFTAGAGIAINTTAGGYEFSAKGQGWVLIQSQIANNSTSIDFITGIDNSHNLYKVVLSNVLPATDAASLNIRVSQSSAFNTDASYEWTINIAHAGSATFAGTTDAAATSIIMTTVGIGSAVGEGLDGIVYFSEPDAISNKRFWWDITHTDNQATPAHQKVNGVGAFDVNQTAIDGIRIILAGPPLSKSFSSIKLGSTIRTSLIILRTFSMCELNNHDNISAIGLTISTVLTFMGEA